MPRKVSTMMSVKFVPDVEQVEMIDRYVEEQNKKYPRGIRPYSRSALVREAIYEYFEKRNVRVAHSDIEMVGRQS